MARRRFFVDRIADGEAALGGEDALHLGKVLRARPGQQYELSDGRGVYLAEIVEVAGDRVRFRVLEPVAHSEPAARVTLLASLIKFDRFEWLVEKATELGVETIVPIGAARSEKGLWEAGHKRVERWRRIARESSQQARRAKLPAIEEPRRIGRVPAGDFRYRYVLEETPGATPLGKALPPAELRRRDDAVAVLIGPEGGWTEREREALDSVWQPVSLGGLILRAETAAIAALAIVNDAWLSAS